MLSDFGIRVVTVVQDHKLYVAKDNLNRVVIGTAFGQIDPVQFKVLHDLPGLARFAGMGAILIQSHPNPLLDLELLVLGCTTPGPRALALLTE